MANNEELIFRGKALKDLRGIKDVLLAQGDPFLANIMNRAIECIENQPAAQQVSAMWNKDDDGRWYCSECGCVGLECVLVKTNYRSPYCPWCGAEMEVYDDLRE